MTKLGTAATVILLVLAANGWAKGQAVKLDGTFADVTVADGAVTFSFTGLLVDSSHPEERSGFPIWDFPIPVSDLAVTATDAICMDHKARRNYRFNDDPDGAVSCYERLEEVVAAVQLTALKFSGDATKTLETTVLSFYDMAQIRRERVARENAARARE